MKKLAVTILLFVIIALTGCSTRKDDVAVSYDGVPIHFTVQGNGNPALVFVHGWCCDKSYWDAQVTHFRQKYKVVAIDLAGHGKSGFGRTDWTMAAFGKDIVAVVDKLGLDQVILVGHSMGGPVILEAARRMTKRVVGLVGVDTFRNVERKQTQTQVDEIHAGLRANFVEATSNAVRGMFTSTSDSTLVEKIVANMSAFPPEVGLGELKWYLDYVYVNNELIRALQEVHAPIRCINSDTEPTNVEAAQRYTPSFKVVYMSGVGHFVMMENPETFNRLLEETIQKFVDQKS